MGNMFMRTKEFNQDISNWKTSSLNNIEALFLEAEKFNQDISKWDVKNVKVYSAYHNKEKKWTNKEYWPKVGQLATKNKK
ncbi:BspA family leucine-rich repeat surface protein [Mycoplasma leachii]